MKAFANRREAARELARLLKEYRDKRALVLGIPRGAVPMAKVIAKELRAELDIVLVHKVGAPAYPEFAVASVTEDGDIYLGEGAQQLGLDLEDIQEDAEREIQDLKRKRTLFTPDHGAMDPHGRICIIVDDGIATGATMIAAIRWLRSKDAAEIVVATPVASTSAVERLSQEGAKVVAVLVPEIFYSVSLFYEDFKQVEDEEVRMALASSGTMDISIPSGSIELKAELLVPENPKGVVLFAHGSGSGRKSPRNQSVARYLNSKGFATVLADLLTETEAEDRINVFDIDLLSQRVQSLVEWADQSDDVGFLPIGLFGASTGAAAALRAAARLPDLISAVVSRGGRPDLASEALSEVRAPTLLIVGSDDIDVLALNKEVLDQFGGVSRLELVAGATHLFEEPGALVQVSELAADWFRHYLSGDPAKEANELRPRT